MLKVCIKLTAIHQANTLTLSKNFFLLSPVWFEYIRRRSKFCNWSDMIRCIKANHNWTQLKIGLKSDIGMQKRSSISFFRIQFSGMFSSILFSNIIRSKDWKSILWSKFVVKTLRVSYFSYDLTILRFVLI